MKPNELPMVTIIVPYGKGRSYETVLESVRRMDYPREKMELLVIEGRIPARQRNAGIKVAKGEVIFFFDDDVTHHPDIIKRMLKFYDDPDVAIVGGPNLTPPADTFLQKCFGYAMCSYFATASMCARYKPVGVARKASEKELILCNLSGRTEVLRKHLLDERLYPAEENEWFNRIRDAGYTLIYDPESVSFHSRRPTVSKFIKQNFGYGRGRMEMFLIQPKAFELLFLVPSLFVLYLCLLAGTVLVPWVPAPVKYAAAIPFALYCLLNILASVVEGVKEKNLRSIAALPFIFPMAQVPYGIGMFWGFAKRFKGWKVPDVPVAVKNQPI
jgi:succinoglycan biosynthesis protein ExoA